MKKRIHQINLFKKFPYDIQKKVFSLLIEKGKSTSFGVDHKFHKIHSIDDFRKQVPVRTYEELFSYIKRTRENEKDVLWLGKVDWFARSSGTTNDKNKYIPISKDSLEESVILKEEKICFRYIVIIFQKQTCIMEKD